MAHKRQKDDHLPLTRGEFREQALTKKEFEEASKKFLTREDAAKMLVTKEEFEFRLNQIEEKMMTRDDFNTFMIRVDKLMEQVELNRQERELFVEQYSRMDDRWHDHEQRISKLEKMA